MTQPCDVLVLSLPVAADIAALEEWREYLRRGIAERFMVLPKDAELEIHELPEPVPLREKTIPSRWTRMPMTPAEIVADYKQAKRPAMQIKVLADLNGTSEDTIRDILAYGGVEVAAKKRGRPKQE